MFNGHGNFGIAIVQQNSNTMRTAATANDGVNLTAAAPSALRPLMLPAVSMFVKPVEIPERRPQVTPGALYANNGQKYTQ
jgi:hypothetical protein